MGSGSIGCTSVPGSKIADPILVPELPTSVHFGSLRKFSELPGWVVFSRTVFAYIGRA
jgi:hypothetical protein